MDTDIDNKTTYDITFLACSFIGKNCKFIDCGFKNGYLFKEKCKFIKCNFDQSHNFTSGAFVRGCEFVQCVFDNILVPNFRIV